jgi:hypothetical protein
MEKLDKIRHELDRIGKEEMQVVKEAEAEIQAGKERARRVQKKAAAQAEVEIEAGKERARTVQKTATAQDTDARRAQLAEESTAKAPQSPLWEQFRDMPAEARASVAKAMVEKSQQQIQAARMVRDTMANIAAEAEGKISASHLRSLPGKALADTTLQETSSEKQKWLQRYQAAQPHSPDLTLTAPEAARAASAEFYNSFTSAAAPAQSPEKADEAQVMQSVLSRASDASTFAGAGSDTVELPRRHKDKVHDDHDGIVATETVMSAPRKPRLDDTQQVEPAVQMDMAASDVTQQVQSVDTAASYAAANVLAQGLPTQQATIPGTGLSLPPAYQQALGPALMGRPTMSLEDSLDLATAKNTQAIIDQAAAAAASVAPNGMYSSGPLGLP